LSGRGGRCGTLGHRALLMDAFDDNREPLIPSIRVGRPAVQAKVAVEEGRSRDGALDRPRDFRSLFDREFSYVWTALRRLGVAARDLEDVTHDVFVEVFRNFARYDPARPVRPWLFAFAFRFASDYRRLVRHRVEIYEEPVGKAADPPADDVVAAR